MKCKFFILMILACSSLNTLAAEYILSNLKISKIRAIGDYSGTTYDNTIEVWFTNPLVFPANCTEATRIYVDKKHEHIISAIYMAFAAGKLVNINVDTNLPIRNGACEISYLDVVN